MKKTEAETAIRALATEWAMGLAEAEREHPSFSAFKTWLSQKGYSHYLSFRSIMGADHNAETWFDQELGQAWRN